MDRLRMERKLRLEGEVKEGLWEKLMGLREGSSSYPWKGDTR